MNLAPFSPTIHKVDRSFVLLIAIGLSPFFLAAHAQPTTPPAQLPEVEVEAPSNQTARPSESTDQGTLIPGDAILSDSIFDQPYSPRPGETKFGMTVPGSIPWSSGEITRDSDRVGPYNQPAWTTQRPFAASRAYVLPAGQAQIEQWVRPTWNKDEKPRFRMLEEFAVGLPGRIQLDIYERWRIQENDDNQMQTDHEAVQIEVRYALADWGKIWLNPTLYAEWVQKDKGDPDVYELKLLLAEQFGERLFYASNLILEQETGGSHETELGWSTSLATPIIQRRLMGGMEMLLQRNTVHDQRDDPEDRFMIGPTLQIRPTNRTFITTTALFGTTDDGPICQAFFICGYQFGFRAGPSSNYLAPSSTIGN